MSSSSYPGAGHICLRCWTRLVHGGSPRKLPSRRFRPNTTTTTQKRHVHRASWVAEEERLQTPKYASPAYQAEQERNLSGEELEAYREQRRLELQQHMRRKGYNGRVAELSMDTPALGGALPIVIIRGGDRPRSVTMNYELMDSWRMEEQRRRALATEQDRAAELQSLISADIESAAQHSRDGLRAREPKEAIQNLEGLRPDIARTEFPQKDLDALAEDLLRGFTYEQLRRYTTQVLEDAQKTQQGEEENILGLSRTTEVGMSALEISYWRSGVTPFDQPLPRSTTETRHTWIRDGIASKSSKERQVWKIIRQVWGLTAEDEIGELEITMADPELSMFLSERRPLLKTIASRRQAKLDVSRSRRTIRVTSSRDAARNVAMDVNSIHKNMRYNRIDLKHLRQQMAQSISERKKWPSPSTLESVAQLTSTQIGRQADGDQLLVYSMGPGSTELDDIRRLLVTSMPALERDRAKLECDVAVDLEVLGALVIAGESSELPWYEREQRWQRFRCALEKTKIDEDVEYGQPGALDADKTDRSPVSSSLSLLHDLKHTIDNFRFPLPPPPICDEIAKREPPTTSTPTACEAVSTIWDSSRHTTTYAVPGLILHDTSSTVAGLQPFLLQTLLSQTSTKRSFSYSVPHLAESIASLNALTPTPQIRERVHIYLIPSPWTNPVIHNCPPINLVVSLDGDRPTPRLLSVHAITHQETIDLMRPRHPTDLRFIQHSHISLSQSTIPNTKLDSFVNQSSLDIRGQARLRTPPHVKVMIPTWIRDLTTPRTSRETQQNDVQDVEVQYVFAGLDHRQIIDLSLDGMRLEWVSVEAGLTGGRRTELRLYQSES